MENRKPNRNRLIAFFLVGIVVGAVVAVAANFMVASMQPTQPTIFEKLYDAGIPFALGYWDPNLLENRTYVQECKNFSELRGMYESLNRAFVVDVDIVYNV